MGSGVDSVSNGSGFLGRLLLESLADEMEEGREVESLENFWSYPPLATFLT